MVAAVSFEFEKQVAAPRAARPARYHTIWTEAEKNELRMQWGLRSIASIARRLERTPKAVYLMAKELELGVGCPQGFEYIKQAAERAGYEITTLRMILRWAGVRIWMPSSDPDASGRNPERVVDPHAVDEAVKAWCATETLQCAAERHGVCAMTILRVMRAAEARGELTVPEHKNRRCHWRVLSADVDRAMAAFTSRERARDAAKRYRVDPQTMCNWLHDAGIVFDLDTHWLTRDVVDRVVAARRSIESLTSAAARHHITTITLSRWLAEAGVKNESGDIRWLQIKLVNEIVRKNRARHSISTAARLYGVGVPTMSRWLRSAGIVKPRGAEVRWIDPKVVTKVARAHGARRTRRQTTNAPAEAHAASEAN